MSTELATLNAELIEPLSEDKARQLDTQIRAASATVQDNMEHLWGLIHEAAQGQIWVALGLPSMSAYLKEAVSVTPSDRSERKALSESLAGKGFSNRTVAAILGVDEKTVRNDTEGIDKPDEITGLDDKTYKRKPKPDIELKPILDIIDVDFEPEERKPADVVEDFGAEVDNLLINVQAFKDILTVDAELFPKARKRCAQRFLNRMQGAISDLTGVVDALME